MRGDASIRPDSPGFPTDEVLACMEREGLLSVDLLLPAGDNASADDLTLDRLQVVLTQARDAGCQVAAMHDHPDSPSPHRTALIDHAIQLGMHVEWFTQGQGIDATAARELAANGVTVALRIDSLDPAIQNTLADDANAFATIQQAIAQLLDAGYGRASGPTLAASISLCPLNFPGLPELWHWLRERHIQPWLQVVSPNRLSPLHPERLDPADVQAMFERLRQEDHEQHGIIWALPPGHSVRASDRPLRSCLVQSNGVVLPVAGLNLPIGQVRDTPLPEILIQSEVLENLRQYPEKLKSPCRELATAPANLSCRSTAWQVTGDYLAPDPWSPQAKGIDITHLPASVVGLIPHGPSVRTIDTLVDITERYSRTRWTIPASSPMVDSAGQLDPAAYIEMIAQSFAASHGFHLSPEARKHHRGLLLGVKNLTITHHAHAGDTLEILTHRFGRFANFGIVQGEIRTAAGQLIAKGEIKIWRPPSDQEGLVPTT